MEHANHEDLVRIGVDEGLGRARTVGSSRSGRFKGDDRPDCPILHELGHDARRAPRAADRVRLALSPASCQPCGHHDNAGFGMRIPLTSA